MPELSSLTERQRFWFEHLQRCEAEGVTLSDYARSNELSLSGLYEAKATLRAKGMIAPAKPRASAPTTFVRVQREGPSVPPRACRVYLPNGTMVDVVCNGDEWSKVLEAAARLR